MSGRIRKLRPAGKRGLTGQSGRIPRRRLRWSLRWVGVLNRLTESRWKSGHYRRIATKRRRHCFVPNLYGADRVKK